MPCVQLRSKEQDGGLRYFRATRKSCCKLYIQSRRFNEAAELCRKARQPRKAARLRGLFYFSDGIIVSELRLLRSLTQCRYAIIAVKPRGENSMEDEDGMDVWSGNQNRQLWKTACTRAAPSVRFFFKSYIA